MSHEHSVMDETARLSEPSRVWAGLLCVALLILALPAAPALAENRQPLSIVMLGDSLTAGYGLEPGESFPERLQQALSEKSHDVVIANAGVSGDTSTGGLARLDWSVPDGTQGVIVELGANDALRGVPPEKTRENLAAIISRLQDRGISVMLTGMLAPPNMGPAYGEAFNAIYPGLASEYDVAFYPFFLDGVAAVPDLNLEDGMHPNARGIDVMVARFLEPAIDWLATISAQTQADARQ